MNSIYKIEIHEISSNRHFQNSKNLRPLRPGFHQIHNRRNQIQALHFRPNYHLKFTSSFIPKSRFFVSNMVIFNLEILSWKQSSEFGNIIVNLETSELTIMWGFWNASIHALSDKWHGNFFDVTNVFIFSVSGDIEYWTSLNWLQVKGWYQNGSFTIFFLTSS